MSKTQADVQQLRDSIATDLAELPDWDVFGGSNADMKEWLPRLVTDLDRVLNNQKPEMEEVVDWLDGKDAWFLNDYVDDLVSKGGCSSDEGQGIRGTI